MQILITGATGLIGNSLATLLVEKGYQVQALVRDIPKAKKLLPKEVSLYQGDITKAISLAPALQGVNWVFHTAGMPEQWQSDNSIFDKVNRQGTVNVLKASLAAGVSRVVYTSTMDVFAAPQGGTLLESHLDPNPKHTPYERSKQAAEREAEAIRKQGLDIVYVNPSAVYGPSPVHIALNSFFLKVLKKQTPLLPPGGMSIAYVEGVANAHLQAALQGENGERYLISDTFVSNQELAKEILRQAGRNKVPPTAPPWVVKGLARLLTPLAKRFRFTPLISEGQLSFLLWQARADSSKAQQKLGFVPTPLQEGVQKTLTFLEKENLVSL